MNNRCFHHIAGRRVAQWPMVTAVSQFGRQALLQRGGWIDVDGPAVRQVFVGKCVKQRT